MLGDRSEIHIRIHIVVFNKAADVSSPSAALFIFAVRGNLITCLTANCADMSECICKRVFKEGFVWYLQGFWHKAKTHVAGKAQFCNDLIKEIVTAFRIIERIAVFL